MGCWEMTFFVLFSPEKLSFAEFRALWHGLFCGRWLFLLLILILGVKTPRGIVACEQ